MKLYYGLAPALMGVSIALVQTQVAVALSKAEVVKIATQITVRINSKTRYGSGVIIKKEGNTYTVLTANHVVDIPDTYEIVTVD
ncbi:MAG: serine protease, partial [Stigonema ocellatum SAG 48.90 = DSM 106950]|nr:serine protease [Stigonema ocellatum SAG 48.90 = DSM 106950]